MAPKVDPLIAKQAKQKKLLIVLGVVLAGAVAFQAPKLLGGDKAAVPATETTATPAAVLPGRVAVSPTTPKPGVTQLASFSLFAAKDPFVAKIAPASQDAPAGSAAPAAGTSVPGAAPQSGGGVSTSGGGSVGGGTVVTVKPTLPKPAFATIAVNGVAEPLALKDAFPEEDELFVLAGAKRKGVEIGVVGGSLAKGKTAKLALGKKLTLVNTATGARYTLELLYVGSEPEQVQGFTSEAEEAAAAAAAAQAQNAPETTP